jgi:hypothetical protein
MKRILLATLLGAGLSSLSFGQALPKDSTSVATITRPVTDSTALRPRLSLPVADTISQKLRDTISVRPDTTVKKLVVAPDTAVVGKETTQVDTTRTKRAAPPAQKSAATMSTSADPYGYKDVHWGMTMRDVQDYLIEHDNVDEYAIQPITNGFEYPGTVATVRATISYQFDNGRLYIVRLSPKIKAVSRFDFVDSFEEYQRTLEAKYGKPTRSGFHKVDDQYLNTIESVQLGFAKKYALWEFEGSYIVLVLAGHDKRLEMHITYLSRAIFEEMKERIETLKLEDF